MVEIGWILSEEDETIEEKSAYLIKPNNFQIPHDVVKIHGITTEIALKNGTDLKSVLIKFQELLRQSDCLIAHNIEFDENVIGAEFIRTKLPPDLLSINKICTMQETINLCKCPSKFGQGYKFPTLSELHQVLFSEPYIEKHRALDDVEICAKCFFELKSMKKI